MNRSKCCAFAILLSFVSAYTASEQSALPRLDPETARELFGIYAACKAYWKAMTQCLPSGLDAKDQAQIRRSFDRLQSTGAEHMKWLAAKAKLSPGMQQRITDNATSRVSTGGKCENAASLVQEHREQCAALFENVASALKEVPPTNQPTAAEVTESVAKFIISTCYDPIDDISRVGSYARIMKWPTTSADQKNITRPADSTFYDIYRGHSQGRPTEVCQIGLPERAESIISRITGTIKTRFVGTDNGGAQITDMYELVSHPGIKTGMMIVGRPVDDRAFFTVAFVGIK
jgi:hypothetical protein